MMTVTGPTELVVRPSEPLNTLNAMLKVVQAERPGVIFKFLTNNFADNMSTLKDSVTSLINSRTSTLTRS